MIRFRRGVVTALALITSVGAAIPSTVAEAHGPTTYEVRQGDSLAGIASKLDVSLTELLAINDLELDSVILPGQDLRVPAHGQPSQTSAAGASAGGEYMVRAGDSLYGIAMTLRVKLSALLDANGLRIDSVILPGQQLNVPVGGESPNAASSASTSTTGPSYSVQAGDSLNRIALRHGVTLAALLAANRMSASSLILPGMVLSLPQDATTTAPAPSATASAPTNVQTGSEIDAVVAFANAQQGKPYKFFSAGPDTFDCSGLTKAAYAQIGITLVHQSAAQARQGSPVEFMSEPIRAGDLVFLATRGDDVVNHVGIALDGRTWIHATRPGSPVTIGALPPTSKIFSVRRLVEP